MFQAHNKKSGLVRIFCCAPEYWSNKSGWLCGVASRFFAVGLHQDGGRTLGVISEKSIP